MPIVRKGVGEYVKVAKQKALVERKADDFDLGWGDHRVYVLDAHEWFDPHTSTNYHAGISRHAMIGPSLIVHRNNPSGCNTTEYHVNDPRGWAWVRWCITQGYLAAETQAANVHNERDVQVPEGKS